MILLAQAQTVAIPVPVFGILATALLSAFGFFLVRYVNQIDGRQTDCEKDAKAKGEKLAALEERVAALEGRFNGSRKTDEILDRLLKHALPVDSLPPALPARKD